MLGYEPTEQQALYMEVLLIVMNDMALPFKADTMVTQQIVDAINSMGVSYPPECMLIMGRTLRSMQMQAYNAWKHGFVRKIEISAGSFYYAVVAR